ncbi:hypothetical protein A3C09_04140 [Candidatus Uhrbacteria bacterium RIFCSPHIGHO2_02_FULL_47_44]|uniref:Peptidase C39-like domain-containing protein n=1 Tax=Candidatus Uhrbacteria bacterium RIFCSPLOWO2_02_FULL_48_18 TaxID=1802408 RepID=A0A1F7VAE7_9BACT|nr:MAG: hypothetical protein A2839_00260 [Candidatus Uhrbacteria bacterium RIFCSPHIGHO2_01_FULL_47_10]OGL71396.1 MAG: hypothetical protein A3C09_04140 [Candidatus Uhrbacteria bacterium RIFCSPHIGHO2_02_FULL_47_44]OGL76164.1 MAG: hypothetical protein A3E97_02940 [Candidatus Uhrbacteria bacterium RIFCSPHIGHO2_12_FULL_47_12]OGL81915.1 MAG: hypothetical protein A3B20_02410 [Candidatus Uhrbacteria bacterium RIFCSPLOWO2_01_FULL_47_17]OGL87078.1 MAG: hypothetical protein A3I41_04000 [Candidatus Uhrbact
MKGRKKLVWVFVTVIFIGLFFLFSFTQAVSPKIRLAVPFSIQIPNGTWVQPFKDACEETSLLMVNAFYQKKTFTDKKDVVRQIQELVALEDKLFGFNKDTSAELMVRLVNRYLPYEAHVVQTPTKELLFDELDHGRPVIVPVNGKLLKNKYYLDPNLFYHVIVLIGYDAETGMFITHDPGTKHGDQMRYAIQTIMYANADFNTNPKGPRGKVMIFTSPILKETTDGDEDQDGLSKQQEVVHGTSLSTSDTDRDGFLDGEEVLAGYSPIVAEPSLRQPFLLRAQGTKQIYRVEGSVKRHVRSLETMRAHGWRFEDVVHVSSRFAETFPVGNVVED